MKIGINGFGRIGRVFFRALCGRRGADLQVVAVNDVTDAATLAHLLKYDSVHGRYPGEVALDGSVLTVDGARIDVLSVRDPAELPWKRLGVDVVLESTGLFLARSLASKHLTAGARRVLLSAPAKAREDVDATIVMGVNERVLQASHAIVSNASCTTNCIAPMAKVLHQAFGVREGFMTTVHAYTNDQQILDLPHKDLRRARAAGLNIIPTSTGAAKAVGEVIPELKGKLNGMAMRVPVPDGSVVDLVACLERPADVKGVNAAMKRAAEGELKGYLRYSEDPLVSSDCVGDPSSCVFDAGSTMMISDRFVKVVGWYDNEWGYSNRLVDLLLLMGRQGA
ncbi:MAG: type I glyceraldehyde-3-phosphate dehydrogenase [Planctomycetes bacterium]|nr:type I glyceraldehyde-3-phosphate dehydrogenase [Planctomycetota bacterium]